MDINHIIDLFYRTLIILSLLYTVLGIVFCIFLKSLMVRDSRNKAVININSWHFKLAYPFKKFHFLREQQDLPLKNSRQIGLAGYFTKIFYMLIFGWPIIICWLTLKMAVYSVILFLFGAYPRVDLEMMRGPDSNPFAADITTFYLPRKIMPIVYVLILTYVWLLYAHTSVTIKLTLAIAVFILAIALMGLFFSTEYFTMFEGWISNKTGRIKTSYYKKFGMSIKDDAEIEND